MPYTEDPAELAGADVAIVGAPTDDLVSDRPGARFGPRAIRAAGAIPIVFGGDHGIAEPDIRACANRHGPLGLRGYWPGEAEFAWQAERGIVSLFMHELREFGIEGAVNRAVAAVGGGPVFLSVDIDVLDPALAPGTGTPEPGGMSSADLLWACRELANCLDLVGAELVEVIPAAVGSADVTALAADRVVREIVTGIALRRRSGS